jgi:hypothetical protein
LGQFFQGKPLWTIRFWGTLYLMSRQRFLGHEICRHAHPIIFSTNLGWFFWVLLVKTYRFKTCSVNNLIGKRLKYLAVTWVSLRIWVLHATSKVWSFVNAFPSFLWPYTGFYRHTSFSDKPLSHMLGYISH